MTRGRITQESGLVLQGADELRKLFETLPEDVQKKIERKAMKDATDVLLAAIKAAAPVKDGGLRDSIKKSVRKRNKKGLVNGSVTASAPHAHLVEYGFIHTGHKKKDSSGRKIKNSQTPTSRGHVPGRPFMRATTETLAQKLVDMFADSVKESVDEVSGK